MVVKNDLVKKFFMSKFKIGLETWTRDILCALHITIISGKSTILTIVLKSHSE